MCTQTHTHTHTKYYLTIARVNEFGKHVVCLCLYDCSASALALKLPCNSMSCDIHLHCLQFSGGNVNMCKCVCVCRMHSIWHKSALTKRWSHSNDFCGWIVRNGRLVIVCSVCQLYTQVTYWMRYLWCRSFLISSPFLPVSKTLTIHLHSECFRTACPFSPLHQSLLYYAIGYLLRLVDNWVDNCYILIMLIAKYSKHPFRLDLLVCKLGSNVILYACISIPYIASLRFRIRVIFYACFTSCLPFQTVQFTAFRHSLISFLFYQPNHSMSVPCHSIRLLEELSPFQSHRHKT